MNKPNQGTINRKSEPVKIYDDLACYRLLGAVWEIPEMIDNLLIGHGPALQRDLLIATHVTCAERLRELEEERR